jgi:hypothetical protein
MFKTPSFWVFIAHSAECSYHILVKIRGGKIWHHLKNLSNPSGLEPDPIFFKKLNWLNPTRSDSKWPEIWDNPRLKCPRHDMTRPDLNPDDPKSEMNRPDPNPDDPKPEMTHDQTTWNSTRLEPEWPETRGNPKLDDSKSDPTGTQTTKNTRWPEIRRSETWSDPILKDLNTIEL